MLQQILNHLRVRALSLDKLMASSSLGKDEETALLGRIVELENCIQYIQQLHNGNVKQ